VAENLGFTIGVCQRFLDELTACACGKGRGFDGRLADRGAFQYELGSWRLTLPEPMGQHALAKPTRPSDRAVPWVSTSSLIWLR